MRGFPHGSVAKESACIAGDPSLIPGLGRSSAEGIGYPLQYSCLGNPMDRGAWWATVHEVTETQIHPHHAYQFPSLFISRLKVKILSWLPAYTKT